MSRKKIEIENDFLMTKYKVNGLLVLLSEFLKGAEKLDCVNSRLPEIAGIVETGINDLKTLEKSFYELYEMQ